MRDRKEERILVQKDVVINNSLKAQAFDISEGGTYIYTQAEFQIGDMLELSFDVDDSPVRMKARVQHIQLGVGIGVKFIGLSVEDSMRIKRLLQLLSHAPAAEVTGKKKVLFIDSDVRTRSVYKTRLLRDGFFVIDASNNVEAIKLLRDSKPDIVIIDLWTEGIDGYDILQLMQMNPDMKKIPVLVLSARHIPADVEKAAQLGARDFLLKMTTTPIRLSEKIGAMSGGS